MKIARLAQAAAIAALFAAGSASAVEMINNGDFEAYTNSVPNGGYAMVANGSNAITGWTVGGVSVDQILNSYNSISGVSIDLLGTPGPGVISQSFNYTANTTYTLSFQLTHNPYAGGGAMMYADFFGTQYQYDGMLPLQTVTLNFTTGNAAGNTTLSFGSIGGDGYSGAVIDNVSVAAAVPEPETYAMLGAGLGLLAFVSRRKAKQAA
jgi:choice-of-anchor C domain-containing protein